MLPEQRHRVAAPLQRYFALQTPRGVSEPHQEMGVEAITAMARDVCHLSDLPPAFQSIQQAQIVYR
jgi:hypothetical protein